MYKRQPYVLGAMDYARALGAPVIGLTCCPGSAIDAVSYTHLAVYKRQAEMHSPLLFQYSTRNQEIE